MNVLAHAANELCKCRFLCLFENACVSSIFLVGWFAWWTALTMVLLLNYSPSAATSAQIAKILILPIFFMKVKTVINAHPLLCLFCA